MDLGLAGKIAVVTGGGSNIGRSIAITLAREGSKVVIAEIDKSQGDKVAGEIRGEGGSATVVETDVTNLDSVEAMVKRTLEEFGGIDILVNNVGWDKMQPFLETDTKFWEKVIGLNYVSVLNCIKSVLPHMIERKGGSIVNISSDAGRVGEAREAVYSGCKAGIIGLSKAIAKEVGRYGVRINVVCPGIAIPESREHTGTHSMWITGGGWEVFTPELQAKIAKGIPLGRLGSPWDIAYAVAFLASDRAGYITGQTLSVSGGYSMI